MAMAMGVWGCLFKQISYKQERNAIGKGEGAPPTIRQR